MKREELEADLSRLLACYGPTFTPTSHGLVQKILTAFDALREERDKHEMAGRTAFESLKIWAGRYDQLLAQADALATTLEAFSHKEGVPLRPPIHCLGEHKEPEHFTCPGCEYMDLCKALVAFRAKV